MDRLEQRLRWESVCRKFELYEGIGLDKPSEVREELLSTNVTRNALEGGCRGGRGGVAGW